MKHPSSQTRQIAETLADLSVHLADVKMPVADLAGGVLVVGQTSAGKTRSVVNNLARQFAEMFTKSAKSLRRSRKFAIFYFALKGRGHLEFLESLSKRRREDVIVISSDKDSSWVVRLFKRSCWASNDELQLAVANFVEEVAQRVSHARSSFRHDPFWDRQRTRILSELARLQPQPGFESELIESSLSELVHDDALVALLARAEAFVDYVGEKRDEPNERTSRARALREELKEHGFSRAADLKRAEEFVAFYGRSEKNARRPKVRALCEFLMKQLQAAREAKAHQASQALLDRFSLQLDPASRDRLHKLVAQWWRIPDVTRGVIEADLRGVIQTFRSGPAERLFRGKEKREISIEEVIHRGLILIIDLPAAESASPNWPALVALKLAITQRLLGRYTARFQGESLSARGVVILQDEAQLLLSDSEAKALAVIRECGVIWVLATQSLSLVASVLNSGADMAAFVASARVRIWGNTGDEHTADLASRFCGTSRGQTRRLASLWHPTPILEAAVTGFSSGEKPLVEPQRFFELKTGQFYLRTSDNEAYFGDLRFGLPKPLSRNLRQGSPDRQIAREV